MQMDLLGAHALGLHNLMLITGDPPKIGKVQTAAEEVEQPAETRATGDRARRSVTLALGSRALQALAGASALSVQVGTGPSAVRIKLRQSSYQSL